MFIFKIREIRELKGISLRKLSKISEVSLSYLSEIENDKKFDTSLSILYKIALALDVNVKDLFYTKLDIADLKEKLYKSIDEKRNNRSKYNRNKSINRFVNKYRFQKINYHFNINGSFIFLC